VEWTTACSGRVIGASFLLPLLWFPSSGARRANRAALMRARLLDDLRLGAFQAPVRMWIVAIRASPGVVEVSQYHRAGLSPDARRPYLT